MNKLFITNTVVLFTSVALLFSSIACEKKGDDPPTASLSISTSLLDVYHPIIECSFSVENSGEDGSSLSYSITEDCDWLTVFPTSGQTSDAEIITVTVDFTGFSNSETRECVVSVTGAGDTETLTVRAQTNMPV